MLYRRHTDNKNLRIFPQEEGTKPEDPYSQKKEEEHDVDFIISMQKVGAWPGTRMQELRVRGLSKSGSV
jgi:hypothetical protein